MTLDYPWGAGLSADADPLDHLVYLSNIVGRDPRLVQPGGGNSSVKIRLPHASGGEIDTLLVKGSGTDLRTISREGFTRLSLPALSALRGQDAMTDADMMRFMASCMLDQGPAPSVETPLHSLLPHRVIVHTHDVATMSLTNLSDGASERLVTELFEGEIVYVPYVRPGFPLAKLVAEFLDKIPDGAVGMTLAHHGLVVWGDDAKRCHERLGRTVAKIDAYLETARRGRRVLGDRRVGPLAPDRRAAAAELLLPVIRGALGTTDRVVLHFDDDDDVLDRLGSERFPTLAARGMATPEHILRAGRLPLWVDLDFGRSDDALVTDLRAQLDRHRRDYLAYHGRHATDERPLDDWAKVVLVPGLGMITAFKDKKSARTANACYRAVMEAIENAEVLGGFTFLPEDEVFGFEHWELERRKVDEAIATERATALLPRHVVAVIGGGSGIGEAAARRFAAAGANVVVGDLDDDGAQRVAAEIAERFPQRAIAAPVDVRDDESLAGLFHRTVLEFGGLDVLFYTAGRAPRFAPVTEVTRDDLLHQLEIHAVGGVLAIGQAARVMQRQGTGGAIIASVSKAALAPGTDAVAYGASKAALLQALRVAAVELGPHNVRVNAINADQIDTPMFRRFVEKRAAARGISAAQQLAAYRNRNLLGTGLIPPDAVADLAVLLASDRFRFTTGDILTVDGGLPEAFPR